ncbi:MAG: FAD-dependent oxidoreductase, partial [Candidatus Sericytochromatia bacterium]|nr:FAD-dependent oxidoreductase [Candidatus Sericytochromatia bacterium]
MAEYDLLVIGGGPGGLGAATEAAGLGARVAVVEPGALGGACLNWGCIPSKALIHAAKVAHTIRTAGHVGIEIGTPRPEWPAIVARIRRVVADLQHDNDELAQKGITRLTGRARFASPTQIAIKGPDGEATLQPKAVIIATGARPIVPRISGLAACQPLQAWQLLELDRAPARLAIIGGGPEGVEFAQACQRLGMTVTLIEQASRLCSQEEPEFSLELAERLMDEGVDVRLGSSVHRAEMTATGKHLYLE